MAFDRSSSVNRVDSSIEGAVERVKAQSEAFLSALFRASFSDTTPLGRLRDSSGFCAVTLMTCQRGLYRIIGMLVTHMGTIDDWIYQTSQEEGRNGRLDVDWVDDVDGRVG